MSKIVVLLKGAHKVGETVQLDPSDIVASAPYLEGADRVEFPNVMPVYKRWITVENIIRSIGIAESLDGIALICTDLSEKGMPLEPNCGDIIWFVPDFLQPFLPIFTDEQSTGVSMDNNVKREIIASEKAARA